MISKRKVVGGRINDLKEGLKGEIWGALENGSIKIWEEEGYLMKVIDPNTSNNSTEKKSNISPIKSLDVNKEKEMMVGCSADGKVKIWNLIDHVCLKMIVVGFEIVNLKFFQDYIWVKGENKNFFLGISVDHQKVVLPIRNANHPSNNNVISFLVKDSKLYSIAENMMECWEFSEKGLLSQNCILFRSAPKSVSLIDQDLFVGNSEDGNLHIYENQSNKSDPKKAAFSSNYKNIYLPLLKENNQNIRHISFFEMKGITFIFLAGKNKICILRKEKK